MNLALTIIWLSCICTGSAQSIERLLAENTKELNETKALLRHIDATNENIKNSIEQQRDWLDAIKNVDGQLDKLNLFLDAQSVVVQEALNNITLKSGIHADRVSKELGSLARLQISTKQQISGLEQKLDGYQRHVLQNARSIENNILDLTKLITRAVLPQLNGLQCSFDSLETSQVNIEVELKSLARLKEISEDSNIKLITLTSKLINLNRTQEAQFEKLTHALSQLKPLNSWQIESALRELIVSQKRIELDLEACDRRQTAHYAKHSSSSSHPSYEVELADVAPPPRSQVWSHKEPNEQGSYYASVYAQVPSNKPILGKPRNPNYSSYVAIPAKHTSSSSVSWQQPLPWETVPAYQSVPAVVPKPKPNRPKPYQSAPASGSERKRPAPNPQPCDQNQYSQHPPRHLGSSPAQLAKSYSPQAHDVSSNRRYSFWHGSNSPSEGY
ncbi:uncharacterized protein LOC6578108 [Drosophila mojavensis]|uniref:Fibrinogen C-terminal domain-containing protein n=1 Tax=Drosophila mojavensis TaxID=7230 RepID=B4KIH5_DROMO|nr:uncharacterized protein LOC6578108 [Drosophila mojavensis]EDW13472.1 uncharacterized protein Dmoj_GI18226 [Drosophila mojavensis]